MGNTTVDNKHEEGNMEFISTTGTKGV
jgi:hypothetical protein